MPLKHTSPREGTPPRMHSDDKCLCTYPFGLSDHPPPPEHCDRQTLLEWRIGVQESIVVGLLEKISLLKAEMLEQLKYTKTLDQEQSNHLHELHIELKGLIDTILSMNKEVQAFEENVRDKWKTVNAAAVTLRNLENHHVSSLADIRNRITQEDHAISDLSQKITRLKDDVLSFSEQRKHDMNDLHGMFKTQDEKVAELSSKIEGGAHNASSSLQKAQEEISKQLRDLERGLLHQIAETNQELHSTRSNCQTERHKLDEKLSDIISSAFSELEKRVARAESKAEELKVDVELTSRVDDVEKESSRFKQQVLKTFKDLEVRINQVSDEILEHNRRITDPIREEMRKGLSNTHDAIAHVKSVLESKIRITEENLQQELGQLRKIVSLS
ncbi:unnamed protein product [Dicrocoelium dendriticum]|nr:unnamed protein product [Dicrocoelium dendriticum]